MQLAAAQQYCLVTAGYGPLYAWVWRHMRRMHTVPEGHNIIITPGNNQTIEAHTKIHPACMHGHPFV